MSSIRSTRAFAVLALLAAVPALPLQSAQAQSATRRPTSAHASPSAAAPRLAAPASVGPTQVVSGSPLSLMFGVLSAEYERTATATSTIGASATLYHPTGWTYASAEGKWRFYPNGALRGFSIGGTGGFTRISADEADCEFSDTDVSCSTTSASATAASLGMEIDYQWFLGAKKNFVVVTGLGAKRLVFLGDELNGASGTLPTVRLGVGYGF